MEWREGDITGLMPYSRLVAPPGDVKAEAPTEVVTVDRADLPEMIAECHELTAALVHIMVDRARVFTSSYLHDDKMVSLGKLAAGLAHELNNPAAALARSAKSVRGTLEESQLAAMELGAACLNDDQRSALERARQNLKSLTFVARSPLEQEDRQEMFERWLKDRNVATSPAETLADTTLTIESLNELASAIPREALPAAIGWIAADASTRRLAREIQEASTRIYELVAAVKGFTHMDRVNVAEPVDIAAGLKNTIIILTSKARARSARISLDVADSLPHVRGLGGELNQVWSNLVDNALDAVKEGGLIDITAKTEGNKVVVRVVDSGSGIPADILPRVFDPFFTTKPVGSGTGLGLDIVRRIVVRHSGDVEVESRPGRTEFRVILPAVEVSSLGGTR
jgi:signal transduction histidine kinase